MFNLMTISDHKVSPKWRKIMTEFDTYGLGRLRSLPAHHMTRGGRLRTTDLIRSVSVSCKICKFFQNRAPNQFQTTLFIIMFLNWFQMESKDPGKERTSPAPPPVGGSRRPSSGSGSGGRKRGHHRRARKHWRSSNEDRGRSRRGSGGGNGGQGRHQNLLNR